MPEKAICPNCQQEAIKDGDEIVCEHCDATFKVTRTGGARVRQIGRLNSLEERVARLEMSLPTDEPESEAKSIDQSAEEDDEIIPR